MFSGQVGGLDLAVYEFSARAFHVSRLCTLLEDTFRVPKTVAR